MKCEHCTRKECSKKTKTDDQENVSADALSPAQENGEKGEFHKLADAKIFLSDCLACDSCMTAEEGVQLSQQNAKDFFRVLNLNKFHRLYRRHGWGGLRKQSWRKSEGEASTSSRGSRREQVKGEKCDTSKHKVLVVSVCPQSLPYFAAKFNLSVTDASRRLCGFLKSLGVHYVFDTTIAADFSILESQKEFVRRYRQHSEEERTLPMLTSACPGEIAQIMEQGDLSVKDAAVDTLFGDLKEDKVTRHDGASSDGHLAHIFRHAAKELFNEDVEEVTYRALRNKDFQEVTLEKNGEVVLRFAAAYGFRNIQNMILKLKKGKFPYHFVEVLACAGGCLNGRGQAQTPDGHADKALLRQMEGIYADIPVRRPESSAHVQELYQEWLEGINSPKAREVLHTTYQSQERGAHSLDIKW
ncbi:nuclear prelamin A recognition factor isoform X5 [Symphalangus syndactylus]|uniref:nuclear prelamin A recognition factor isoform X5 n=1 Tax=Symphalangus syndactylus TaxID=9590 RepID=UPI002441D45B|nr:nuclear prelamin A recognition factor isoform X4 [Symphalangus syndactylus]